MRKANPSLVCDAVNKTLNDQEGPETVPARGDFVSASEKGVTLARPLRNFLPFVSGCGAV